MIEVKQALALPEGLKMTTIELQDEGLTVTLVSTQTSPRCPLCHQSALRTHSRYTRHLSDLPCGGQRVSFQLQARKYFCTTETCERKVFTERFSSFVAPWARVTARLFQIVQGSVPILVIDELT